MNLLENDANLLFSSRKPFPPLMRDGKESWSGSGKITKLVKTCLDKLRRGETKSRSHIGERRRHQAEMDK